MNPLPTRRRGLQRIAALAIAPAAGWIPAAALAQTAAAERQFTPQPGAWRTFDIVTRIDVQKPEGATRVWVPAPTVNTDWQQSGATRFSTNGKGSEVTDAAQGVKLVMVDFAPGTDKPFVEVTSRFQTRNRAVDWSQRVAVKEDAASLKKWMQPTELQPLDGIVLKTSRQATRGAYTERERVQAIYDWVVANTYREPKVRGCGTGDVKTMLETGNMGGKCGDINGLFVALVRAAGIPARDVYGIRLVPSAFGYKELSGNPASLKGAQHCRAEVHFQDQGWVAMDPADVAKVMRLETPDWIKTTNHPVVAPVNRGLFGGWEGNWLGYNTAHDVQLPGAKGAKLGFFMYPAGETAAGTIDSLDPDNFKYQITATEIRG